MVGETINASIITTYPFPENMATANRVNFFLNSLISLGIKEVNIICIQPNDIKKFTFSKKIKVNLIYIGKKNKRNKSLIIKIIHEFFIILKTQRVLNNLNSDLYIYTIPSILLIFNLLKKNNGIKLVDFRDIVWKYIENKSSIHRMLSFVISLSVKHALKKVNYITVTNGIEKKFIESISNKKCTILKNGIEKEKFYEISCKSNFKEINFLNPTISYIGNIGLAQNLSTLIKFANINKNYNLRISGDGAEYKKILELSKNNKNIKMLGHINWEDVVSEYIIADILYAQIKEDFYSALPTKPFEYLAAKRPIILGLPEGIAKETFSKFKNVYICEPDNIKSLSLAFNRVLNFNNTDFLKNEEIISREFLREDNISKFINMFK